MIFFDDILPRLSDILGAHWAELTKFGRIAVNRDLNGRVRLIIPEAANSDAATRLVLNEIASRMAVNLAPHTFQADEIVLFEPDVEALLRGLRTFPLAEHHPDVVVVDRMAVEGNWADVAPIAGDVPRVVFFSIKGGVGRSTAAAAVAWAFAEAGKRVLVLDLDIESPGLSSSFLPPDRVPNKGSVDWLVEDLVGNGDAVLPDMAAQSPLSRDGTIIVVPAHGEEAAGDYIAKLGRAWMPKISSDGIREPWAARLRRMIDALEATHRPDITLIDSRSGIDDVANACVSGLGASTVLMFALDDDQTWISYDFLFMHWFRTGAIRDIRERLSVVAAMVPSARGADYVENIRQRAWRVFSDRAYDEVPAGDSPGFDESWQFDLADEAAPHSPWRIHWNDGMAAISNLHRHFLEVDPKLANAVFGDLISGVSRVTAIDIGGA